VGPQDHGVRRLGPPAGSTTGRAIVIGPYLRVRNARRATNEGRDLASRLPNNRTPGARLDEAVGLALAIDLDVVERGVVAIAAIRPSTYLGKGKVDQLAARGEHHQA